MNTLRPAVLIALLAALCCAEGRPETANEHRNVEELAVSKSLIPPHVGDLTDFCTHHGRQCKGCGMVEVCHEMERGFRELKEITCTKPQYCSPSLRACTSSKKSFCNSGTNAKFDCNTIGIFPDPFDCNVYHICVSSPDGDGLEDNERTCGQGTRYHAGEYKCVPIEEDYTKCESDDPIIDCSIPDLGTKEGEVPKIAALEENEKIYYVCGENDIPQLYRCMHDNQAFNAEDLICEEREDSDENN